MKRVFLRNAVADWHQSRYSFKMQFRRLLQLDSILKKKSAFLFGARGSGKTTLIRNLLPEARVYDLLEEKTYLRLLRDSKILEQENSKPGSLIVIDEIQKLPKLLDEVQRLVTQYQHRFLLTGSSARKLKREGANLLGGRARELHLYPLTWKELGEEFDLLRYLNYGGLPDVYQSEEPLEDLYGYVSLYLREEVAAEAIVRRIDQFSRFLDVMALNNGEELHYENIASDTGIKSRTLSNYVEILEDTLLGFRVTPFESTKRKAISRSKFYLFDLGVTHILSRGGNIEEGGPQFGKAFEHWIALELHAAIQYLGKRIPLHYWRTKTGFEVDFVVGKEIAIEVKATSFVTERHLKGLLALKEEGLVKETLVIAQEPHERLIRGIRVLPWQKALKELWEGAWF